MKILPKFDEPQGQKTTVFVISIQHNKTVGKFGDAKSNVVTHLVHQIVRVYLTGMTVLVDEIFSDLFRDKSD